MIELKGLIEYPVPEIQPPDEATVGTNLAQFLSDRQVQGGITQGTADRVLRTDFADHFSDDLLAELILKRDAGSFLEGPVAPALRQLEDFILDDQGEISMWYLIDPMKEGREVMMTPDIKLKGMKTLPDQPVFAFLPYTDPRLFSDHELTAYIEDTRGRGSRTFRYVNSHITNIILGLEKVEPYGAITYADAMPPKKERIETKLATLINHRQHHQRHR